MRLILGLAMFGALAMLTGSAVGQDKDKIDGKKLVGKWATKDGAPEKFTVVFTKDGKMTFDGDGMKIEGTYKLDGNKLTIKAKVGDKEETMVRIITKLTDTEITSKDEKSDKEDTLVRVKGKDKK